ncbi:MAG: outer membrane protein assembly factor BamE [Candidatus Berkiella sp.]
MKTLALRSAKLALCGFLALSLNACFIRPYKFDLTQGNLIDAQQIGQIQPGMSEEQVKYVLGTPMLEDVFHTNRWDYVYYEKPSYGKVKRSHLAIYFDRGVVSEVIRDPLPQNVG